ncbi:MAG: hypothetical protein ACI8W8_001599 [Rhodothermales bacterium]|jgi:hypothetical protein
MNSQPINHIWKLGGVVAIAGLIGIAAPPRPAPQNSGPQPRSRPAPSFSPNVNIESELMITDLRVVEDRRRTDSNNSRAPWTFRHLIENMAGDDPAEFAMNWLLQWETDQMINGQLSAARPAIRDLVIDPWLAKSGGDRLDLSLAPFKLLSIVNRIDLRSHEGNSVDTGGEGRFVFGVLDTDGNPLPPLFGTAPGGFVIIFEYELIADDMNELRAWANEWHALGSMPIGSRDYNARLERITRRFTDRNRAPLKANRNALNQLRTNELSLSFPWELREFVISADTGMLTQKTVAITPGSIEINGTELLRDLINDNEDEILDGTFALEPEWFGATSLSGPFVVAGFPDAENRTFTVRPFFEEFVNLPWSAAGIRSNDARHVFAVNTCNGCHNDETGTSFLQIGFPQAHNMPESLGSPAELAGFLTGIEIEDPVEPETLRSFNDLDRRQTDLQDLLSSFGRDGRGPGPRPHRPSFVH